MSEHSATAPPVPRMPPPGMSPPVAQVAGHHVDGVVDADPERDREGDEVDEVDLDAERIVAASSHRTPTSQPPDHERRRQTAAGTGGSRSPPRRRSASPDANGPSRSIDAMMSADSGVAARHARRPPAERRRATWRPPGAAPDERFVMVAAPQLPGGVGVDEHRAPTRRRRAPADPWSGCRERRAADDGRRRRPARPRRSSRPINFRSFARSSANVLAHVRGQLAAG